MIVGLPETTFRRRLRKAADQSAAGLAPRPDSWGEVRRLLDELVRSSDALGRNLLELSQQILLEEVVSRVDDDVRTATALLGVSAPTYARRRAAAEREGAAE